MQSSSVPVIPTHFQNASTRSLNPSMDAMISILDDSSQSQKFHASLRKQHSPENSEFYLMYKDMEKHLMDYTVVSMDVKVRWLYEEFIVQGSVKELNLPEPMVRRLVGEFRGGNVMRFAVLKVVKDEVVRMMYDNNYSSFMAVHEAEVLEQDMQKLKKRTFLQRFMTKFRK